MAEDMDQDLHIGSDVQQGKIEVARSDAKLRFWGTFAALGAGILLIVAGVVFVATGVYGEITGTIELAGWKSRIEHASPGLVLCLLGTVVLCVYSRARWRQ